LYIVIDFISRGEVLVDLAYVRDYYGLTDYDDFDAFWTTFYGIYVVWSFVALVVMVPVMSKVL
jgi:hypothetical protein